jgi:hypothetical protein
MTRCKIDSVGTAEKPARVEREQDRPVPTPKIADRSPNRHLLQQRWQLATQDMTMLLRVPPELHRIERIAAQPDRAVREGVRVGSGLPSCSETERSAPVFTRFSGEGGYARRTP